MPLTKFLGKYLIAMSNNIYTNIVRDIDDDYIMGISLSLFLINNKKNKEKKSRKYLQRLKEQAKEVEYEEI